MDRLKYCSFPFRHKHKQFLYVLYDPIIRRFGSPLHEYVSISIVKYVPSMCNKLNVVKSKKVSFRSTECLGVVDYYALGTQ